MYDIAIILIYMVALFSMSRAAVISVVAVLVLTSTEGASQYLFTIIDAHFAFDYLVKLLVIIPWTYLLFKSGSKSFILIFSSACFEVLMAIDALMSGGAATSLVNVYPNVVLVFHAIAGVVILVGKNGNPNSNPANFCGDSDTRKARKSHL